MMMMNNNDNDNSNNNNNNNNDNNNDNDGNNYNNDNNDNNNDNNNNNNNNNIDCFFNTKAFLTRSFFVCLYLVLPTTCRSCQSPCVQSRQYMDILYITNKKMFNH